MPKFNKRKWSGDYNNYKGAPPDINKRRRTADNMLSTVSSLNIPYISQGARAVQVAKGAYDIGRKLFGSRGGKKKASATKRKYRQMTTGRSSTINTNNISKFRRVKKKGLYGLYKYHTQGYVDTVEVNGTINDPNCVYIGHSAQCNEQTTLTICRALLRKLFLKCVKYDGISSGEEIPGKWYDNSSDSYRFILLEKNVDTNAFSPAIIYDVPNDATITSISSASGLQEYIRKYANGFTIYTSGYKLKPFKMQLYRQEFNVTVDYQFIGEVNMEELIVHIKTSSTIKIQNRTESATGSADEDDVNNSPLIGKRYITNGLPKTRDQVAVFSQTSTKGVKLIRGDQIPATSSLKEPPSGGYFVNCIGTKGIKIMPGDIKYSTVYFSKHMNLLHFLKLLRYDETDNGLFSHNIGQCDLYALEDAINVNGEEKINCAYEVNRVTAVYFTEKRKRHSIGQFNQFVQSNVT